MKYFGQFFYGKSLLDIAVCLYPVGHFLYNFCIGHWNFFLRNYFRFCFRICQKFFFRLYILLKSIFHLTPIWASTSNSRRWARPNGSWP